MRSARMFLVLALLLTFSGSLLLAPTEPAQAQSSKVPRFEKADCWVELPAAFTEGENVECGYVIVRENRSSARSRTIKLAVAVFKGEGKASDVATIFLQGGPGGPAIQPFAAGLMELIGDDLLAHGDFIFLDQRGVGLSEPALVCDETNQVRQDGLEAPDRKRREEALGLLLDRERRRTSSKEAANPYLEAMRKCYTRLSKIADLAAYNSAENAADLNDIRAVLGYDALNLYGVSYGTRLALTAMRDFPKMIRSAILDSVYPPQADLFTTPVNAERAFNVLFNGCADDETCNEAYPDLENTFYSLVAEWNDSPAEVRVEDPMSGKDYDIPVNGDSLINFLFQAMYATSIIPELPKMIYEAKNGDTSLLGYYMGFFLFDRSFSDGMYVSVQCGEEAVFTNPAQVAAVMKGVRPAVRRAMGEDLVLPTCEFWKSRKAGPVENEPVVSDIPTLILAGEYDPITPPSWGRWASATLSNSYFYEFPGVGHGAFLDDECAQQITFSFLGDPESKPDDSCLAEAAGPEFAD